MEHEYVKVHKNLPEWKRSFWHSPKKPGVICSLSLLIFILPAVSSSHFQKIDAHAACISPKLVLAGNKTEIICTFDANYTRHTQNVYLEHFNQETKVQEVPVSCQISGDTFKCICIKGYTITGEVSERLSIEITEVLHKHAGIYWCGGFQPDPFQRSACDIKVIDGESDSVSSTSGTMMKYKHTRPEELNEDDFISIYEIIIIVAILIFSLITIFFVWNLSKRRCGPMDKNSKTESQESLINNPWNKNSKTEFSTSLQVLSYETKH